MSVSNPDNNEELVLNLMNFSPFGAMGQAFIINAIREYSKAVVKDNEDGPWFEIAKDVQTRCDAFYSRHDPKPEEGKG